MTYSPEFYVQQYGKNHIKCFCCDRVELDWSMDGDDYWPICMRCSLECPNYIPCASSTRNPKEKNNQ